MNSVQLFAVTADGPQRLQPPEAVAGIHDLPAGLPFGVYTAFRTFEHNRFLELQAHLDRLQQSMALLDWAYTLDQRRLRQALHAVCSAYPGDDARVRVDVLAAPATMLDSASRELITLAPFTPLPERAYREGVRVAVAPQLSRRDPLVKDAGFVLARRETLPDRPAIHEYLLCNDEGRLLEGSSSNFTQWRAARCGRPAKVCWKGSPGRSSSAWQASWPFRCGWKRRCGPGCPAWRRRSSAARRGACCRW